MYTLTLPNGSSEAPPPLISLVAFISHLLSEVLFCGVSTVASQALEQLFLSFGCAAL